MHWDKSVASLLAACLVLASCSTAPPAVAPADWHARALPGKPSTQYRWTHKDGQAAWHAIAERSASLWRTHLEKPKSMPGEVEFSWWAQDLVSGADVREPESDDAVVRVVFAFGGDTARLSMRNRMMFDLAHTLTGEAPPYATLMYVWCAQAPTEQVVVGHRSDRVRTVVVESGRKHLRQWRHYKRNLREDFRRAFGEEPGPLLGMAVMTDADNTASRAEAWYGAIRLR
jgi:hypothetical protein